MTLVFASIMFAADQAAARPVQEDDDTFFSGTVDECSAESLTVTREVLGNPPEHRTFKVTAQTKVEGKLAEGARVTVKFRVVDDSTIAETIIVREPLKPKKKS